MIGMSAIIPRLVRRTLIARTRARRRRLAAQCPLMETDRRHMRTLGRDVGSLRESARLEGVLHAAAKPARSGLPNL